MTLTTPVPNPLTPGYNYRNSTPLVPMHQPSGGLEYSPTCPHDPNKQHNPVSVAARGEGIWLGGARGGQYIC